jgi:hypothetical protein
MSASEPLDPRVAELLSAHLDGAVSPEERALAEQWIASSPDARAEYESLAAVKAVLGGLGEVEPPFGFYDRMLRQGTPEPEVTSAVDRAAGRAPSRRRRSGRSAAAVAAAVVASAAAFVVIGGTSAPAEAVRPPIEAVASGDADGVVSVDGEAGQVRALRQEADDVAWGELPRGVRRVEDGAEVWEDLTTDDGAERVVVFRDGVVVTVFAEGIEVDLLVDQAIVVVEEQPADDGGAGARVREAFEGLLDSLSP